MRLKLCILFALVTSVYANAQFWKKKVELPGIASPMLLQPGYTTFPLTDYFLSHENVAAISLSNNKKIGYNAKGEAVFAEESYPPLMNLNCETNQENNLIFLFSPPIKKSIPSSITHRKML